MKTRFILAVCSIGILLSCQKREMRSLERDMEKGEWKIVLYYENGLNETGHFNNYIFNFNDDNKIVAEDGENIIEGSFNVHKDDDRLKFELYFPVPLDELSEDWHVVEHSSSRLELFDEGGGGTTDRLISEKI